MQRYSAILGSLALAGVAFLGLASGCGKKEEPPATTDKATTADKSSTADKSTTADKTAAATDKGGEKAKGAKTAIKAGDGVIKGKIIFDGEPPTCTALKEVKETKGCLAPPGEEFQNCEQKWIVGKDNGVKDALIFLKVPDKNYYFEPSEADKKRTDEVVIDQPFCAFVPHVVALYPAFTTDGKKLQKTGQKFKVKNSASFSHNSKLVGGEALVGNVDRGETLTPGKELAFDLFPQKSPINLACDVHTWMRAKIWVFDHPYSAVTKEDGTFEIKNVPTGSKILIVGWHDGADYFYPNVSGTEVTLQPGETKTLEIKVKAK
jgi:hypothetical protein